MLYFHKASPVLAALAATAWIGHAARAQISGFGDGSGFTLNNNGTAGGSVGPAISTGTLQITTQGLDGNGNPHGYIEANSAFDNTRQSVSAFTASFTYRLGPLSSAAAGDGLSPADGMAFVLENAPNGAQALGSYGGDLGYAGITPSAAVAFNLFGPNTPGTLFTSGGVTTSPGPYTPTGSVNLASGDPIDVQLAYNGATLTETLTDTATSGTFTTSEAINLAATVGGPFAFVGFTGGTGFGTSDQFISNFAYTPQDATVTPEPSPSLVFALMALGIGGLAALKRRQRIRP